MIRKSVWLCAILAALTAAPTARAQQIDSWADLLPLIEGRGESVLRRMELVPGSVYDLGGNVNDDYFIREQLTVMSGQGGGESSTGQLLRVSLTRKTSLEEQRYTEKEHINFRFQDIGAETGILEFTPTPYPSDFLEKIVEFYVYLPNQTMQNPKKNLQISYVVDAEPAGNGSFAVIYPGCFRVKTGIDEIDHGGADQNVVSQTCAVLPMQDSVALADWDIRNGLTGSGWLRARVREGQNEFEGLILVLQPADSTLDLSTPAPCDSPESGCGAVAETFAQVVPELMATASSSKYYALAVGPVDPANGAVIDPINGALDSSTTGDFEITTENVNALEMGLGLYVLSIPPALTEGDYPSVPIPMELSGKYGDQDCNATVTFVEGLSSLAAPARFNCENSGIRFTPLPQIAAVEPAEESMGPATAEGITIQLRTGLTDLFPSLNNANGEARERSISNGACAGYAGAEAQVGELQLFCLSGGFGDEKLTFSYRKDDTLIAYMESTTYSREAGSNSGEAVPTKWTINPQLPLDFTIQFVGENISPAFWERLSIKQSLVEPSASGQSVSELHPIDFEINEDAGAVTLTLPAQVADAMLADLEEPAFQIDVTTQIGNLSEPSSDNRTSLAYFPRQDVNASTSFFLNLKDLLFTEEPVVTVEASVANYDYAGQAITVRAELPRTNRVLMPCSVGIRIGESDYWLLPRDDRAEFIFPQGFPRVSDGDLLTVIAGPPAGASSGLESATEKLCPKATVAVSEVLVSDMAASGTLRVPLTRPVLAYFLRSATSDDKYGTRNNADIYRVGFAPVLDLQQERVVAFYTPIRAGADARSFQLVNRISAIDPFIPRDMEGRVSDKLAEIMNGRYIPDGSISIGQTLRGAALDREDFGLSGPYWPDIVILASGGSPISCTTIERALPDEALLGGGPRNATLSIFYDSFSTLDSGEITELGEPCEFESSFGQVNLFKTSLSSLFNTGRGRFDLADEVQSEWEAVIWKLAGGVED